MSAPTLVERVATAPLPVYFGMTAAAFALVSWPLELVVSDSVDVGSLTTRALVFGALMSWFVWRQRQRQRPDGVGAGVAMAPALRSGELPADADPAAWGPALVAQRAQFTRAGRTGPIVFGAVAVLAVLVALTESGGARGWWLVAAGFVLLAAVSLAVVPRQLQRIDRLQRSLEARPGPSPSRTDRGSPAGDPGQEARRTQVGQTSRVGAGQTCSGMTRAREPHSVSSHAPSSSPAGRCTSIACHSAAVGPCARLRALTWRTCIIVMGVLSASTGARCVGSEIVTPKSSPESPRVDPVSGT